MQPKYITGLILVIILVVGGYFWYQYVREDSGDFIDKQHLSLQVEKPLVGVYSATGDRKFSFVSSDLEMNEQHRVKLKDVLIYNLAGDQRPVTAGKYVADNGFGRDNTMQVDKDALNNNPTLVFSKDVEYAKQVVTFTKKVHLINLFQNADLNYLSFQRGNLSTQTHILNGYGDVVVMGNSFKSHSDSLTFNYKNYQLSLGGNVETSVLLNNTSF